MHTRLQLALPVWSRFQLARWRWCSVYWLLMPAADRLVRRLVAPCKDGVVLDSILLLILGLFVFQLKEKGHASPKATCFVKASGWDKCRGSCVVKTPLTSIFYIFQNLQIFQNSFLLTYLFTWHISAVTNSLREKSIRDNQYPGCHYYGLG